MIENSGQFISIGTVATLLGAGLIWFLKHHFNEITKQQASFKKDQSDLVLSIKLLERDLSDFKELKNKLFEQLRNLENVAGEVTMLKRELSASWKRIDELQKEVKRMAERDHDLRNYVNVMANKLHLQEMKGFGKVIKEGEND